MNIGKKKVAFLLAVILVLSVLMPTIKVLAAVPQNNNQYGSISIGGDVVSVNDVSDGTSVTVTFSNGNTVTLTGSGLYSDTTKKSFTNGNNTRYSYEIYGLGDVTVSAVAAANYTGKLWENGQQLESTTKVYTLTSATHLSVDGEFQSTTQGGGQGGEGGQQGEGGQGQNGGPSAIEFDIKFENTHICAWINNVVIVDDADGDLKSEFKGTINGAGETAEDKTNVIRIISCFGDAPIKDCTINGVKYENNSQNVSVDETDGGWTITVPAAAKYTITGTADTDAEVPRTIIWTNPGYVPTTDQDEEWIQEFCLEHGAGYIKAIYDAENHLVDPKTYIGEGSADTGVNDKYFGWAQVKPGSKVIFRFIPEYGYQLVDIKVNGQSIGAGELINEFVFNMPDTNVHFDAVFEKTDNIVKSGSDVVKSGEITLGDNTLNAGTAKLTVNNAEVSDEKKEQFDKAAGEYTIKNILGVDLYQIFYKGKNDSNDVWSSKIDELTNEATITLKLDDDIDINDIVIVHNVHDGEDFEIIEIESYDADTHTITFKVKSFSNYAIATKASTTSNGKNPSTGDSIMAFAIIFTISAVGIAAIVIKRFIK